MFSLIFLSHQTHMMIAALQVLETVLTYYPETEQMDPDWHELLVETIGKQVRSQLLVKTAPVELDGIANLCACLSALTSKASWLDESVE